MAEINIDLTAVQNLTADLEQETKINPEPETNHDLDEEEELPLPYNFDIEPICSGEDIKFGDLPDFLDLKGFDEYLPDLKPLLDRRPTTNYSEKLFFKSKSPNDSLPTPIDFSTASATDLAKSKTKLKKEHKHYNKSRPLENWYNMSKPELTEELENDLKLLHNRSSLDPKKFFRKNDKKSHIPKNFEVARIVNNPLDGRNNLTRKERKGTFVEEILNDENAMRYQKKRVMASHTKQLANMKRKKFDVKKHKRNLKRRREKLNEKKD